MATEQDQRPDDGQSASPSQAPDPQPQSAIQQGPWSWKFDIASLSFSVLILGAMIGTLAYFEHKKRDYWHGPHQHRIALGSLLLALYLFLLIPSSNCLYRLKSVRRSYPIWPAVLNDKDEEQKWPRRATEAFFTTRLFGIAPFLTFAMVVAAASVVVPWTQAIFGHQNEYVPGESQVQIPPWVMVATDLKPDGVNGFKPTRSGASVLNAIHQAIAGYVHDAVPAHSCDNYRSGQWCRWDDYASLQVRARCQEISASLDMSSTHSIFQAMRNVTSIPPYNPVDESRGIVSSPTVMSLKNTTFLTLSNLLWYAEPRRPMRNGGDWATRSHEVSEEAWKRLREFSAMVINPVSAQVIEDPVFNQTAGTLANFQVIYAELGITGYFKGDELNWLDIFKGESTAFECSLDTVVQPKTAQLYAWNRNVLQEWDNRQVTITPLTNFSSSRSCQENSETCDNSDSQTIDFLWDNTKFSIDKSITSMMSRDLNNTLVGSGFVNAWGSKNPNANSTTEATSDSMTLILHQIYESVNKIGWGGTQWNIGSTFTRLGQSLSWWMRSFYTPNCEQQWDYSDECAFIRAFGSWNGSQTADRYFVQWEYIAYPAALVVSTALIMFAAALDQKISRIRLPAEDDSAGEGEEPASSTSDRTGVRPE